MSDEMKIVQNDDGKWGLYDDTYDIVIHCESAEEQENAINILKSKQWIPADQPPEVNANGESEYILLSFSNCTLPVIGSYRKDDDDNGAYYNDDADKPLCSYGLFVNAWMPLPEPYKEDEK